MPGVAQLVIVMLQTLLHCCRKAKGSEVKCSAMMNLYSNLPMSGKGCPVVTSPPHDAVCNLCIACDTGCNHLISRNTKKFAEPQ